MASDRTKSLESLEHAQLRYITLGAFLDELRVEVEEDDVSEDTLEGVLETIEVIERNVDRIKTLE